MINSNPDVPLEAVVKYLVKERDKANAKLEQLVGYTKSLEHRVKEMEKEMDSGYTKAIAKVQQQYESRLASIRAHYKKMLGQLKVVTNNYEQYQGKI